MVWRLEPFCCMQHNKSFQPTVASVTPVAIRLSPATDAPVGSLSLAAAASG
jgi:hypothetical protein